MTVFVPTCAIVGYTNAGKSSLLNKLTHSDILAEDKLFTTLDPTSNVVPSEWTTTGRHRHRWFRAQPAPPPGGCLQGDTREAAPTF